MEQNNHYATQNRKELGVAISKNLDELDAQQFGEMLDLYDKDQWTSLSSITVPEPKKMINEFKKLKSSKKRRRSKTNKNKSAGKETAEVVEASAAAQSACCDFLNELIELLPHGIPPRT